MRGVAPGALNDYSYGGAANANPDAVTQIATGYSTTTFQYDNDGNVMPHVAADVLSDVDVISDVKVSDAV
jgi:hypothetical protein